MQLCDMMISFFGTVINLNFLSVLKSPLSLCFLSVQFSSLRSQNVWKEKKKIAYARTCKYKNKPKKLNRDFKGAKNTLLVLIDKVLDKERPEHLCPQRSTGTKSRNRKSETKEHYTIH